MKLILTNVAIYAIGLYKYGGTVYNVSASHSGSSFTKCWRGALKALKIDESCKYRKCTFGGVWNGGSGDGQKNLLVASYFYDRAAQVMTMDFLLKPKICCVVDHIVLFYIN